jgi:hypothetical protein
MNAFYKVVSSKLLCVCLFVTPEGSMDRFKYNLRVGFILKLIRETQFYWLSANYYHQFI